MVLHSFCFAVNQRKCRVVLQAETNTVRSQDTAGRQHVPDVQQQPATVVSAAARACQNLAETQSVYAQGSRGLCLCWLL